MGVFVKQTLINRSKPITRHRIRKRRHTLNSRFTVNHDELNTMADDEIPKQPVSSQPEQNVSSEVQKTTSSTESPTSASSSTLSHETQSSSPPATTESAVVSVTPAESREELIARARSFLTSPQIQHEDIFAKRRFLSDKGLNDTEINGLLQELVSSLTCIYISNPSFACVYL